MLSDSAVTAETFLQAALAPNQMKKVRTSLLRMRQDALTSCLCSQLDHHDEAAGGGKKKKMKIKHFGLSDTAAAQQVRRKGAEFNHLTKGQV